MVMQSKRFEEINSLLSEARLFGWLMNSTLQWDSNPGPWNKAPSRQQYMNNALKDCFWYRDLTKNWKASCYSKMRHIMPRSV